MTSWAVSHRPGTFRDIIGQDMVNEVLKGVIRRKQPPPSVLCAGRTGTGKTTTLRVYFKAINCSEPDNGEPCNKCESCVAFSEGSAVDFLEVDASTAGGVESMRNLAQDVRMVPLKSRYRGILIDEVHAMSKDGFNVLLKMIEEPGDHLKFGFATTEVDRVPKTILGRCIKFNLRPVGMNLLKSRIVAVCSQEKLSLPEDVINEIAVQANGQVRDAIMMAEQMSYLDQPTAQSVRDLVGLTSAFSEKDFLLAMEGGDINQMAQITNDFIENHVDVDRFLNKLISILDAAAMRSLQKNSFKDFENLSSQIQMIIDVLIKIRQAPEVGPAMLRYWAMTRVEQIAKALGATSNV